MRWMIVCLCTVIILSGCAELFEQETAEETVDSEEDEQQEETDVGEPVPTLSDFYRNIFPDGQYDPGEGRGYRSGEGCYSGAAYNRVDLERLEVGLSEISSETFQPEDYFFQEGQFIDNNDLDNWLARYQEPDDDDEEEENAGLGLNPELGDGDGFEEQHSNNPCILSHIIEQNYHVENDDGDLQLAGVSVALSLNSIYYFREQNDDGSYGPWMDETISEEEALEAGEEMGEEVVSRLRAEEREEGMLNDVPIVVALFREAPRNSTTPGEFIATATAEAGSDLGGWDSLSEDYYFFPSDQASDSVPEDTERFTQFADALNSYFSNHIGVTARGYYQNNELSSLTIQVPIRFQSQMETIAVTQQAASEMEEHFQTDIDISITITSNDQPEALITRDAGEEANVHIYE
ncbi:CamS family sex pheromone protein [Natribacillus halophilus]|uniref:Protein involved in sex pheromone biosynthesis n=1 Tax=Natribacillus halophilus TaxID=549003 RepID=A0A1G8P8S0_9BACI|nr:CamS family sex pheromone protein [Natribacillus halophilus]SDI88884.1 Protein involved in sex pheromone biosynthesis [Natribacillus halophilus]